MRTREARSPVKVLLIILILCELASSFKLDIYNMIVDQEIKLEKNVQSESYVENSNNNSKSNGTDSFKALWT